MKKIVLSMAAFLVVSQLHAAPPMAERMRERAKITENPRAYEALRDIVKDEKDPALREAMIKSLQKTDGLTEEKAKERVETLIKTGKPEVVFRGALDIFSRDRDAVRLDGNTATYNRDSVVGDFYASRERSIQAINRPGNSADVEKLKTTSTLSKLSPDVVSAAYEVADRLAREDVAAGRGGSNSSQLYFDELIKFAQNVEKGVAGQMVGEGNTKTSFGTDKAKAAAERVRRDVSEIAMDAAALGKTPQALAEHLKTLGDYFQQLGSPDAEVASGAERAIKGLKHSFKMGTDSMKADFLAMRDSGKLSDKVLKREDGSELKVNAKTLNLNEELVGRIEKLMPELLKGVDLERPMVEVLAKLKERLESNGFTAKEAESYLDLYRARATVEVVELILRLEREGKFAPEKGVAKKFFCNGKCMEGLVSPAVLAGAFGESCNIAGGPSAAPGKSGTGAPTHNSAPARTVVPAGKI